MATTFLPDKLSSLVPMSIPTHTKLLIAFGILYFLIPIDIFPDWTPFLGRLDDIVVLVLLYRRYKRLMKEAPPHGEPQVEEKIFDPYAVFDLPRSASKEEIDTRYKVLLTQYHPDKVHHLGAELQKLAHEKMLEIQSAYKLIRR